MARRSEHQELVAAWRALGTEMENSEGWHTISLAGEARFPIQAGRRFPGNEEALLLAFSKANVPSTEHLPQGKGFSVSRVDLGPETDKCWLAISRRREGNLDLFTSMVQDIIDTLRESGASSEDRISQLLFSRIRAWQDFMRRDTDGVLEPEAELGLVGELLFLQLICRAKVPPTIPITGWVGPVRGIQDFVLGSGAIEVKTTIAVNGFTATIDSLDQLDDGKRQPLFLAAVRVRLDERGLSLPDIIDETRTMITDPFDKGAFDTKLLHAGYLDVTADQYTRHFVYHQTRVFRITERFPRITRYAVSPAIIAVRYELDIERVAETPVALSDALELLGVS
jgi:hypothetical protein